MNLKRSSSKAETLLLLRDKLKTASIEDIFMFTVDEWNKRSSDILHSVREKFSPKRIVVRSSSVYEDTPEDSKAGYFHSQLHVDSNDIDSITLAVSNVVNSYTREKRTDSGKNQIMVQPQIESVLASGVIFTRQIANNAPYYIINYDDASGRTDTVTGGTTASSLICIFREAGLSNRSRWYKLLSAVKEIESHFQNQPLDIEFAVTTKKKVIIFQVRPLSPNRNFPIPDDAHIKDLIESMKAKYKRFSKRQPHLSGEKTVFGDMPDWNPAEIIGGWPRTLDYTLYSFLFTDSIWHEARTTLGYKNVFPGELMSSFGKRPYIDMRLSFNSFTPADIPGPLREKLLNYYIDKITAHPEKQDKVEFEILWTCYNFSLSKELKELKRHSFSKSEIRVIEDSLHRLTNNILQKSPELLKRDMEMTHHLTQRKEEILKTYNKKSFSAWDVLTIAYNLLQNCKMFGALPFARLARLAFISKNLLVSMRTEGIISDEFYHLFLNSLETVASHFSRDLLAMQDKRIDETTFYERFGHLRPGTYDITAPRYDTLKGFFRENGPPSNVRYTRKKRLPSHREKAMITEALNSHGIHGSWRFLFDFISRSIEYREYSKFEFTKTLSDALEFIALGGEMLGFSRSDLSHVDLTTLMKFRNPEYSDVDYAKKIIRQSIERHKKEKHWSDMLILPPVILSERDFELVSYYEARPNFITNKVLQAKIVPFNRNKFLKSKSLSKYIVALDNADPGFDWIFAKEPLGIITKYGGAASHMAIRCAEFGIPAAIGCGAAIYDRVSQSKAVLLDCTKRVLVPLTAG